MSMYLQFEIGVVQQWQEREEEKIIEEKEVFDCVIHVLKMKSTWKMR